MNETTTKRTLCLFPVWNDQFSPAFDWHHYFPLNGSKFSKFYLGNPLQSQLFKAGFELVDCHFASVEFFFFFFPLSQFSKHLFTVSVICFTLGHYQWPVIQNRKVGVFQRKRNHGKDWQCSELTISFNDHVCCLGVGKH